MPQLDVFILFSNIILVLVVIGSILFIFFQIKSKNLVFLFQQIYLNRYLTNLLGNIFKMSQSNRLIKFGSNKFYQL